MGVGGILHSELAASLYGEPQAPVLSAFVGGLGGRDISADEFFEIAAVAKHAAETGHRPPPRLLYTEEELREVRKLQTIALAERHEISLGDAQPEEA